MSLEGTAKTSSYGIVARDAAIAIIFRRGPSRHVQLLRWNLRDDSVDAGQWLVGTVNVGASHVSPSGETLVYSARKGARRYTAISRPPYFTSLAFWEERLPWTGGGFFVSDAHVVLGTTGAPDEGVLPGGVVVSDVWSHFAWQGNGRSHDTFGEAARKAPEAHHGWSLCADGRRRSKTAPRDPGRSLERDAPIGRAGTYRLWHGGTAFELGALDWADLAPDGTLVFGNEGRLYRQAADEAAARRVADLTGHRFARVAPPKESLMWPRSLRGRSGGRK